MNRMQEEHRLDQLVQKINEIAKRLFSEDAIVIYALTNYGFIRLAGYIEQAHKILFEEYARKSSPKESARFVISNLARITNLNAQKCIDLLNKFSADASSALRDHPDMQETGRWKIALDGTYNVRNSQAHGQVQTMNLTTLNQYVKDIKMYFEFIEGQIALF